MKIEVTPKAADVYQIIKAPTNKCDLAINTVGMLCSTAIVLGLFAVGTVIFIKSQKGD